MEIKDLINVQEQFVANDPYAYAIRVFDNDGNMAATMARVKINDTDWIDETSPESHLCIVFIVSKGFILLTKNWL